MADNETNKLRRRGKQNGTTGNMNNDKNNGTTNGSGGGKSNRQSMNVSAHADDADEDLDRPLIAGEEAANQTTVSYNGRVRVVDDSDDEAANNDSNKNNSDGGVGSRFSHHENLRGTLTTRDNGSWNRLSCVSDMLAACVGGFGGVGKNDGNGGSGACSSNADGAANNNGVKKNQLTHTAIDVKCSIIDKLPTFLGSKFGPNKVDENKRRFVDAFRAAFAVPYSKHDKVHVTIVKELYRVYYSVCCNDIDPLLDMSDFLEAVMALTRAKFESRRRKHQQQQEEGGEAAGGKSDANNNNGGFRESFKSNAAKVWGSKDNKSNTSDAVKGDTSNDAHHHQQKTDADEHQATAKQNFDPISSEFWKMIGFQGTDPGTDFRGGGVLSLLLLLHLFKSRPDLIRSIFRTREKAPNVPPPKKQKPQQTFSSDSDSFSNGNSGGGRHEDPDFHYVPPFFKKDLKTFIEESKSQSTQLEGGESFMACEYPFAIAGINVAMHLMLLMGLETKTTCISNISSSSASSGQNPHGGGFGSNSVGTADILSVGAYSTRLAKDKVLSITFNDNGNCTSHDEPVNSCRWFLVQLLETYKSNKSDTSSSFSNGPKFSFGKMDEQQKQENNTSSSSSPPLSPFYTQLVDGFDHLAAIFEVAITVMHNEWCELPPKDKSILFFNQVLKSAREKMEGLLRHCDNLMELGKAVSNYEWVEY